MHDKAPSIVGNMKSAVSFNSRHGCGAANLSLFHSANSSDGCLSSRRLLERVFAELIVKWPIIAPFMTEQEWSGIMLVRKVRRVPVNKGNRPMPSMFLVSLTMSPCP